MARDAEDHGAMTTTTATVDNDDTDAMKVDVIIVGAGQAGMAAAYRLMREGKHSIHVIEGASHVGGRTRNLDVKTGNYDTATDNAIELGGTWISPDHTALLELCRELDIDVFRASFINKEDEERTTTVLSEEDGVEEEWPWWYWGPDYSEKEMKVAKKTLFHQCTTTNDTHVRFSFQTPRELMSQMSEDTVSELNEIGAIVDSTASRLNDLSWEATSPGAHWSEMDSLTTSAKLLSAIHTNEARNILQSVIHNKNAQEPEQVGFLYNMLSFKGCNSTGADSEYRVRGGTQAVPLAIADKLGPTRLTLGDAVKSVRVVELSGSSKAAQQVQVATKSGKVFTAKALIVTGSPPAILGIEFDPPLPAVQAQLLQRMPMGTSRKFIAVYKRGPWWHKCGYTGDILASGLPKELSVSIGASNGKDERVPIFGQCFDTSPFSQEFGVLTCFVEGRQNLYFSNLTEEEQRDLMRQFLKLTFQDLEELAKESKNKYDDSDIWEPDIYETHNWSDDPFARGAYTAYFPPGVLSVPEWWEAYRKTEKLPNVFLAGADYHAGFGNGYMEGAVRSGQHAAELVNKRLAQVRSSASK